MTMTDVRRQGSPSCLWPLVRFFSQPVLLVTRQWHFAFLSTHSLFFGNIPPLTFYREGSDIMTPTNRSSVRHDIMTLLKVLSSVLRFHEISVVTTWALHLSSLPPTDLIMVSLYGHCCFCPLVLLKNYVDFSSHLQLIRNQACVRVCLVSHISKLLFMYYQASRNPLIFTNGAHSEMFV